MTEKLTYINKTPEQADPDSTKKEQPGFQHFQLQKSSTASLWVR